MTGFTRPVSSIQNLKLGGWEARKLEGYSLDPLHFFHPVSGIRYPASGNQNLKLEGWEAGKLEGYSLDPLHFFYAMPYAP